MTNETGRPGSGWHPDPWFSGQHRFWDGRSWTADVFPDGPVGAYGAPQIASRPEWDRPPVAPPTVRSTVPPPPPTWGYGAHPRAAGSEPWELLQPPAPVARRLLTNRQISALALAVGLVLGFVGVEKAVSSHGHKAAAKVPSPVAPLVPTVPASPSPASSTPVSNDPAAPVLQRLVVRQQDVSSDNRV